MSQVMPSNEDAKPTVSQPTSAIYSSNATSVQMIVPTSSFQRRDWTTGLCGCFEDISDCCFIYFCTMCYMCSLFSRANESCWSCIYGGMVPLRTKVRTERGIQGSICGDFCAMLWCPCCAMLQMGREMKNSQPLI